MTTAIEATTSVNPAAEDKKLPGIKPQVDEIAQRLEAQQTFDATTNVIATPKKAVDTELEKMGHSSESVQKMFDDLHTLNSAHTLSTGRITHAHWATQTAEERAPVVAPLQICDAASYTATHVPHSVERNLRTGESVDVYGQVNGQKVTAFGRNTGQMSAVRQNLRASAAKLFNK